MKAIAAVLTAALLAASGEAPLEYRFAEVKSTVNLRHGDLDRRAAAGDVGVAGDEVRTGWRGRAVVEVAALAARFEILPSTRARLGGPQPGVLLVLERGRLKAVLDALTGSHDRLVATPGALLAVRGTRYGVEVAADGSATVAVFEGTVEVRPTTAGFPVTAVAAGELCRFGPHTPPQRAPLPRGVGEESWRGGLGDAGGGAGTRVGEPPPGSRAPAPRPGGPGTRPGGGHG